MAASLFNSDMKKSPMFKRRKIRKGTNSCWECKRRKTRCTFANPNESICDGCRSRGVSCISQAFQDDGEAVSNNLARLNRMQAAIAELERRTGTDTALHDTQEAVAKTTGRPESNERIGPMWKGNGYLGTGAATCRNGSTEKSLDDRCAGLLAGWPSQHELDLITSLDSTVSVLFHGTVFSPYSTFLSEALPKLKEIFRLPSQDSHPVLMARKLLMLGSFLQGIAPKTIKGLGALGVRLLEIMTNAVETACRLVTSNDNLVCSVEGIECIMIESMYHNNAGNLRQAWMTNRRAMTVAQVLRLHDGDSRRASALEVKTWNRVDPEYIWLRLVTSDRYLSLMLGLPQGSQESPFASPKALEACPALERLERLLSLVAGLIIQRNREDLHDLDATHKIDKLLQDAESSMPAQWWLPPEFGFVASSDTDAFLETIRIVNHFSHYHLLVQLHLPFLLRSSADKIYDYSKITAVNASRELLSRFVRFRSSSASSTYCRGIDFLAFVASAVLCIAYINVRRQDGNHVGDSVATFQFLVHQRLTDRGLMERTLEMMESMAQTDNDDIALKIARILKRLLTVEAAVADGGNYNASLTFTQADHDNLLSGDGPDTRVDVLRVDIPHIGTFQVEPAGYVRRGPGSREGTTRPPLTTTSSGAAGTLGRDASFTLAEGDVPLRTPPPVTFACDSTHSSSLREELLPTGLDQTFQGLNGGDVDFDVEGQFMPVSDDWMLQGVDMVLFENLFDGQRELP
ncbi:hypothetical protein PV08_09655 [Exophiala spinifera]|uniref:Zn(2)-C6 fungal-type domain-containing protein n=1 Tax=Exophiala spinifera TaxID=91928 RepID=A0A0D2B090_9EURO|nr:uncharacterized protein PV08_09655 [Exophiala spinifera]KIW12378.1 hypothetical protein PV08_09655 [Exophiala spinifera]